MNCAGLMGSGLKERGKFLVTVMGHSSSSGLTERHSREAHFPFLSLYKFTTHLCCILPKEKHSVVNTIILQFELWFQFTRRYTTMTKLSGFVAPWFTGPFILPSANTDTLTNRIHAGLLLRI